MIDTIFLEMRPTVVQVFVLVIMKLLNQSLVSSFFKLCSCLFQHCFVNVAGCWPFYARECLQLKVVKFLMKFVQ